MLPPVRRCRWAGFPFPLFAALFLGAAGCDALNGSAPAPARKSADAAPLSVPVVKAELRPWPRTVRIQGSLVADEEAIIGAEVAGRVEKVLVDRGTAVKQGQTLAELEQREFDLGIRQAEDNVAQVRAKLGLKPGDPDEKLDPLKAPPVVQERALVEEARYNRERAHALLRQGAGAREELDRVDALFNVAQARYDSAVNTVREQIALLQLRRTELEHAKQRKAESVITAPFAGVVQDRRTSPGSYLAVGQPVLRLVRIDPLRFRGGVPEREADRVRVGDEISVLLDGVKEPLPAKINRISPALEMASRSLIIEADVPNPGYRFRAGVFAQADITVDPSARALAVPEKAVTEFAGVEKAWVVKDGKAEDRRVLTGRRDRGFVEISQGLKEGDTVLAEAEKGRAGVVVAE